MFLQRIDETLFPRDQACRPYWSVSRAYFMAMAVFLVGVTFLQLLHLFRLLNVPSGGRAFGIVFLIVFLIFQLTVVYVHSLSVACLYNAGGSCQSLAKFWLVFAALHQVTHSILPLLSASIVAPLVLSKAKRG